MAIDESFLNNLINEGKSFGSFSQDQGKFLESNPDDFYKNLLPINPQSVDQNISFEKKLPEVDKLFDNFSNKTSEEKSLNNTSVKDTLQANTKSPSIDTNSAFVKRLEQQGITFNFQPNELHNVANYTYNWKLSMANDTLSYSQIKSSDDIKNLNRIIIAETALTNFNIISVEIDNLVGAGFKNRTTNALSFEIEIYEPQGISLLDRLFSAAKALRVSNWNKCPYFLELTMKGYKEDGTEYSFGKNSYRAWRVMITKFDVKADEKGSSYSISLMQDGDLATRDSFFLNAKAITVTDVGTIGDFFKKYQSKLNELENEKFLTGQNAIVIYKIELLPAIADMRIKSTDILTQSARSAPMNIKVIGTNKTEITIQAGTSIDVVASYLIQASPDGEKWVLNNSNPSDISKQQSNSLVNTINILRTDTKIEYKAYDPKANDYVKELTVYIRGKEYNRAVLNQDDFSRLTTEDAQAQRVKYFVDHHRLNKAYDYYYTGLNVDILNFDIAFQSLWYASLPLYSGVNQYANATVGPKHSPLKDLTDDARKAKAEAEQKLQTANSQYKSIISAARVDLESYSQEATGAFNEVNQLKENLKTKNDKVKETARAELDDRIKSQGETAQDQVADSLTALGTTTGIQGTKANPILAEDLPVFSQSPIPVSILQNPNDPTPQDKRSVEAPRSDTSNPSLVSSIWNQIYGATNVDLLKIELEIRGDLYWIGPTNIDLLPIYEATINYAPPTFSKQGQGPIYADAEHMFVLNVRFPNKFQQNTGLMEITTSEVFNGIYAVLKVKSNFKNGLFTQTLECVRDLFTTVKTPETTNDYKTPTSGTQQLGMI